MFTRLKQLKNTLKHHLIELNLFSNDSIDNRHVICQRIGTRLYLLILTIAIIAIILSSSLRREIRRQTVLSPTEFQYRHLHQTHSNSLLCSCNVISMPYKTFISIEPIYDQACSSYLISSAWIDYLNQVQGALSWQTLKYRTQLGGPFTILRALCESVQRTIDDALRTFLDTQFVSSVVIAPDIFDFEVQTLFNTWQVSTVNRYQYVIELLRAIYQGNLLMNDRHNFQWQISNFLPDSPIRIPLQYENCSCGLSGSCSVPFSLQGCIDDESTVCYELLRIPGFFTGCSPVETLFQSTLQCFSNRTCVDALQAGLSRIRSSILNISMVIPTEELLNETTETVESMVNRLMVNKWQENLSFTSYYQVCAPISCTFEYIDRPHILFLITSIVGVIGGLSTALKILMLILVRSVEKIVSGYFRLSLLQLIKRTFVHCDQRQMAHRIHIILVVVTLSVLFLTIFLVPQVVTIEIAQPSLAVYQNLSNIFSDSLQCPCSKISIEYESFVTVQPRFHQICSSDFMSQNWILYVDKGIDQFIRFNRTDFQATATGQFHLLASLCKLSQKITSNALSQLLASGYFDAQLTSTILLEKRIQALVEQSQLSTSKTFINTFNLIRETIAANALMSVYATNGELKILNRGAQDVGKSFGNIISLTNFLGHQGV